MTLQPLSTTNAMIGCGKASRREAGDAALSLATALRRGDRNHARITAKALTYVFPIQITEASQNLDPHLVALCYSLVQILENVVSPEPSLVCTSCFTCYQTCQP